MSNGEPAFVERNIYEGLPGWLSQIYVRKTFSGYFFVFFGYRRIRGIPKYPSRVTGRRRPGYFGDLTVSQLSPELILGKFPRALDKLRGEWLANLLKLEINGSRVRCMNEAAAEAYQELPQETKQQLKKQAIAIAGPHGYMRDPHAILFLVKELIELGVPIKDSTLIGNLMLEIGDKKL